MTDLTDLPDFDLIREVMGDPEPEEVDASPEEDDKEPYIDVRPKLNANLLKHRLKDEPVLRWILAHRVPKMVANGYTQVLATLGGESAKPIARKLYASDEACEKAWGFAQGKRPPTYKWFQKRGWDGTPNPCHKSPVDFAHIPNWVDLKQDKGGRILPDPDSRENATVLLQFEGVRLRTNVLDRWQEVTSPTVVGDPTSPPRNIPAEMVDTYIRNMVRRHDLPLTMVETINLAVADERYSPVADYLNGLTWDGKDRWPELFSSIEFQDNQWHDLYREMIQVWMRQTAKIGLVPADAERGVGSHGVLILQGPQGVGKTRWLASIVPNPAWFKDGVCLDPGNRDSVSQATRSWVVELGELGATFRKADVARLKAFLTENVDMYRAPYARVDGRFPRRTAFAGSVNEVSFLRDTTGNRRYWVVAINKANPEHGIDLDQLWAQAVAEMRAGKPTWLPEETRQVLVLSNANSSIDPLEEALMEAFDKDGKHPKDFSLKEILQAMDIEKQWNQTEQKQVKSILVDSWGVKYGKKHGVMRYEVCPRVGGATVVKDDLDLTML